MPNGYKDQLDVLGPGAVNVGCGCHAHVVQGEADVGGKLLTAVIGPAAAFGIGRQVHEAQQNSPL
jgi:hypothetical protein